MGLEVQQPHRLESWAGWSPDPRFVFCAQEEGIFVKDLGCGVAWPSQHPTVATGNTDWSFIARRLFVGGLQDSRCDELLPLLDEVLQPFLWNVNMPVSRVGRLRSGKASLPVFSTCPIMLRSVRDFLLCRSGTDCQPFRKEVLVGLRSTKRPVAAVRAAAHESA
jgi:hypothetical protein